MVRGSNSTADQDDVRLLLLDCFSGILDSLHSELALIRHLEWTFPTVLRVGVVSGDYATPEVRRYQFVDRLSAQKGGCRRRKDDSLGSAERRPERRWVRDVAFHDGEIAIGWPD